MTLREARAKLIEYFPEIRARDRIFSEDWSSRKQIESDEKYLARLEDNQDDYPGIYLFSTEVVMPVLRDLWLREEDKYQGEITLFFKLLEEFLGDINPLVREFASVEFLEFATERIPSIYKYMGPRARQGISELRPHFNFEMPAEMNREI
jgi:hypothetical protein